MSEPLGLNILEAAIAAFEPIDPLILDMLPPATAALAKQCKEIAEALVETSKLSVKLSDAINNEADLIHEALKLYSVQSGDALFLKNFELCYQQVKMKKGRQ